jgi:hypothetical protein
MERYLFDFDRRRSCDIEDELIGRSCLMEMVARFVRITG